MSYRPVALAAPWDLIMFFMYSTAFRYMQAINKQLQDQNAFFAHKDVGNEPEFDTHKLAMYHKAWNNLAGMLLFLVSTLMGVTLLWIGRKNKSAGREAAV